jgi:hypothetical protein
MIPANGAPHDLEAREVRRTLPFAQRRALRLAPGYLLPSSPSVAAAHYRGSPLGLDRRSIRSGVLGLARH